MSKAKYFEIKTVLIATIIMAFLMGGVAVYANTDEVSEGNMLKGIKSITAVPNKAKVLVNGNEISFESYGINGYNYFRIRDIASVIKNTDKCFQVEWDGQRNAINLFSNKTYTFYSNSVSKADVRTQTAVANSSQIYKDGNEISLMAYTINENNFIKLRDIGQTFNFGVDWDNSTKTIEIDTNKVYFNTSSEAERSEIILSKEETEVIKLVNIEREKAGMKPLEGCVQLSMVAGVKSEDMVKNNYYAHNSPSYGSPFEMMKTFKYSYRCAGENIARGQKSAAQVVTAWMNSDGHRANILNEEFSKIGVGLYQSCEGSRYWTQMFTD